MKATHFLIDAESYAILEMLMHDSYGDDQTVLDNAVPLDLSEEAIEKKATKLYTTYSAIGNNTMVNGISIEGYKDCARDIKNLAP